MISRKFAAGATIYHHGEAARSAFEVREGQVRLVASDDEGRENSTVLGIGQVFGAAEMISGKPRQATAKAEDEVVVSEIGRDELARLLADGAPFGESLLLPAFNRLRREAEAAEARAAAVPSPSIDAAISTGLHLRPAARELSQQMEPSGVPITHLPFLVGRRSTNIDEEDGDVPIDLSLKDSRPYTLSRRHFAVERLDGGYVVRDWGSHLGTIVNGAHIGGKQAVSVAPLAPGDNQIVAGRSLSPFRFVLTVTLA